ncbi:APC family permease [Thiothrix nivea]|uniref:Amino acid permease-associated region n=1 Tax=Thiothrix nivea (strain ATCC 35100 / DSM 5205 / JP2) TaxID=870187 RepID=A0A656HBX2_THINJ|nr:amino acid permease [Thiothrix nivea]EIJ33662.1 amino acid permease-associated region [Thiothrix nivea DSM 5205]
MYELKKTLGFFSGTALFLNIVIGAGLLILPGIVYQQVGQDAIASWILVSLISIPILIIFTILGIYFPNSGGVTYYAEKAFGNIGKSFATLLLLGAVVFGLPSIALTGAYYFSAILPFQYHFYAALLILLPTLLHLFSGKHISTITTAISSTVIVFIIILLFFAIRDTQGIEAVKLPHINNNIFDLLSPFMIIFFAFTGWEIGAHSAEEFKNPKRDFPIAMLFSFLITTILYLTVAFLVQQEENITDPLTPFIGILKKSLGDKAVLLVSLLATLIVFANLFGAIWGVSRLIYSLSRDKIIPKYFSLTNKQGTPIYAIILANTALLFVLALDYYNFLSIESMLSIAGQNFLILYGVASCALFFLSKKLLFKIISITVVLIMSIIIIFGGVFLPYPLTILIISYVINFTGNKN